ncbi:MAG: vWA domain-containing protein [bacterium]|jgi:hypothetical protein
MNFLNPSALFFAFFIPAVIVLYLLKLKRTDLQIPSTLLWRRSLEDLKANTPFQKLKRNLLLLLQLIIIALLTFAVARPVLQLGGLKGQSFVVLIDNSASMSATDVKPARLEEAKQKAIQLVNDMSRDDRMMVIAFSSQAEVLCPFERRKGALRDVIERIQPTDRPTQINEALKIAESAVEVQPHVEVFILSDGRFPLSADAPLAALNTHYIPIGNSADNIGIIDLVVRRDYAQQQHHEVLVGIQNCGTQKKEVYVELFGTGNILASAATGSATATTNTPGNEVEERNLMDARRLVIEPGASEQVIFTNPGYFPEQIEVEVDSKDVLASDNKAWAIIPATEPIDVLLVTSANEYLQRALNLDPRVRLANVAPAAYAGPGNYDLVVFDNFAPPALIEGNYFFINAVPPLPEWSSGEMIEFPMIVDWDRMHPLLRYVNLENLTIKESLNIGTPAWATIIAEARETPLIVAVEQENIRILMTAFDIYNTNWPLRVSFPIFITNVVHWFDEGKDAGSLIRKTGEVLTLEQPEGQFTEAVLLLPDGSRHVIRFPDNTSYYFGDTRHAGIYTYLVDGIVQERFAVNLLSVDESTIVPVNSLQSERSEVVGDENAIEMNREIWRTLAVIALIVLCVEWYIYTKRARYAF